MEWTEGRSNNCYDLIGVNARERKEIESIDNLKSQKAALLAACKMAKNYLNEPVKTSVKTSSLRVILKSAIEQAGESGG
jgi:hypothetical protein